MLKHLSRSGMNFLLYIFNLVWFLHSFSSIWKASFIVLIHKMGQPLDFSASFRPISLTSCVLNASFYGVYSSFWSLTSFSLPATPVSALDGLSLIKFLIFFIPFWMGLTNPSRALGRFFLLSTCSKLSTLSGTPLFSTNLFRLASLLALLAGLNLSYLIGALAWFFKISKDFSFESIEVFRKDPFLALLLFSLFINNLSASLPFSVSCSLLRT